MRCLQSERDIIPDRDDLWTYEAHTGWAMHPFFPLLRIHLTSPSNEYKILSKPVVQYKPKALEKEALSKAKQVLTI